MCLVACQQELHAALGSTDVPYSVMYHIASCCAVQMTAFKEIAIMQRLSNVPGICRVHDFGICNDSIMLVMTKYRCSLREWRHRQPEDACHQLRLYLNVFAHLASLLQA